MVRLRSQHGQNLSVSPSGTIQLHAASLWFAHCRQDFPSARAVQCSPEGARSSADSVIDEGRKPSVIPHRMQTTFSKCSSWPQFWQEKVFIAGPCYTNVARPAAAPRPR